MTYAIHDFMTERLGLRGNELLLYALIYAFSQDGSGCFYGGQSYAAKKVGCTREWVGKTLASFEERGLVSRSHGRHGDLRRIDYVALVPEGVKCELSSQCEESSQCELSSQCEESSHNYVKKVHKQCEESSHNNKKIIKINKDSANRDITIKKGGSRGKKKAAPNTPVLVAEKISFADFVSMTQREHDLLVEAYGEADAAALIDILNNYKGSKGVTYKSDYLAIKGWVVKRLAQDKAEERRQAGVRTNDRGETATVASMRAAEESFKRIADRYAKPTPKELLDEELALLDNNED